MSRREWLAWLAAAGPTLVVCGAGIRVCNSCGKEVGEGLVFCGHCGARQPGVAAPEPATPTPASAPTAGASAGPGRVSQALVDAEAERARGMATEGRMFHALVLARGALALQQIAPTPQTETAETLRKMIHAIQQRLLPSEVPCFLCQGRGFERAMLVDIQGESRIIEQPQRRCPLCGGNRVLARWMDSDLFLRTYNEALRQTEAFQQQRGWHAFHGVWLPPEVSLEDLSLEDQARLLTLWGGVCETCLGLGRHGCEACEGVGRLPCPGGESCVNGMVLCPTCDGTKVERIARGAQTATRTCRACQGRGVAPCEECGGKGYLECEDCRGRKGTACDACDGMGRLPTCEDCGGRGLSDCRRCKGSGQYRDKPCTECAGKGRTLCEGCDGTGHEQESRRRRR